MASAPTASLAVPLWVLATIATAFFLRETRELFVPIAFAVLISYALYPVMAWLVEHRVPRIAAATLLVGGLVGILVWGVSTLGDDVRRAVEQLPQQLRQVQEQLRSTGDGTLGRVQEAAREAQRVGAIAADPSAAEQQPAQGGERARPGGAQADTRQGQQATGAGPVLGDYLWQGSMGLVSLAGHLTAITFLVFFILLSAHTWRQRLIATAGDGLSSRRTAAEVIDEINSQVQRFLLVRLVTSIIVGVGTWLALAAMGAPGAVVWGLAAGALNTIPFFGPLIVSVGLFLVGLASGGIATGVQYALVALAITSLEGWLITPPLMGRAAQMNTLAVLVGLLAWSWAWGVWGTLLAVPMLMVLKAVCDHVERLNPLARLLEE